MGITWQTRQHSHLLWACCPLLFLCRPVCWGQAFSQGADLLTKCLLVTAVWLLISRQFGARSTGCIINVPEPSLGTSGKNQKVTWISTGTVCCLHLTCLWVSACDLLRFRTQIDRMRFRLCLILCSVVAWLALGKVLGLLHCMWDQIQFFSDL